MDGYVEHAEAEEAAGAESLRIVVVGVGGAAGRVLGRASREWKARPVLAAVDTDQSALEQSGVRLKVAVGRKVSNGFGTGGESGIGRLAAEEDEEALRQLVSGRKLLLLLAGLGGGAGAGIAPEVARIAREENVLTVAFATMPYDFEGEQRQALAKEAVGALKESCDAVVCLSSQQVLELLPEGTPMGQLHEQMDRMLLAGVNALWTLVGQTTIINLDFSDLQSLVEDSPSQCDFAYGAGEGEGRVGQALEMLLDGRMGASRQALANAGAMILCVAGGEDLTVADVTAIQRGVAGAARAGAEIKLSAVVMPEWKGRIEATLFMTERWGGQAPRPTGGDARHGQAELELSYAAEEDRGCFQGSEQDLYNGVDLDLPTFIRQGVRIPSGG